MWLRANKSKIGFKLPDQVYEPIMLNIKVEEEFAVQVPILIQFLVVRNN
jgi:hypothetical protein